jgi:pyruvate kinase
VKKTKIIATLGPVSFNEETILGLINNGMDVARINMSHYNENIGLDKHIRFIREQTKKINRNMAILFDLGGPKIRVGKVDSGTIKIKKGSHYTLGGTNCDIPLNKKLSFDSYTSGGEVKVNDGNLSFDIVEVGNNTLKLLAHNSGEISSGKGVNFPGVKLDLPSLTEKDKIDLQLAVELGADWLAMSFVRSANDYSIINKELERLGASIPVIAKIEKPEAIDNLGAIIDSFDGILVARGDLGVEMPLKELPVLQKKIVNECLQKRKPVIIATQMLDTMIQSPNPTRAEVNDIANAIYDGADAMMLSGETTVGEYAVESVKMMAEVATSIDKDLDTQNFNRYIYKESWRLQDFRGSICHAAMILSNDLSINNIVIMTETGLTAMKMARYRPKARIFALCTNKQVCSQLSLIWGVTPILVEVYSTTEKMISNTGSLLKKLKYVNKGDLFIITAGVSAGVSGTTNMLKIHEVE